MKTLSIEELKKLVLYAGILSLAVFIPFSESIQNMEYHYQLIPFFISMIFLGLPHGAMDHLVPLRLSKLDFKNSFRVVTGLYILLGIIYAFWWYFDPLTAFIFFIIITWVHWGQGDLYAATKLAKTDYINSKLGKTVFILVRGGIPMLVPFVAYPNLYIRFVSSVLSLFPGAANTAQLIESISIISVLLLIGSLTVMNALIGLFRAYNNYSIKNWLYNQSEVLFLWLVFLSLPPIFAVGLYFCFWHSLRHIARLSLIDGTELLENLQNRNYKAYISNLSIDTVPLTLLSLLIMATFSFLVFGVDGSYESLIAVYLVGISVLTLPHFVLVSWMDKVQKIWIESSKI